jgi:hypothetical protein
VANAEKARLKRLIPVIFVIGAPGGFFIEDMRFIEEGILAEGVWKYIRFGVGVTAGRNIAIRLVNLKEDKNAFENYLRASLEEHKDWPEVHLWCFDFWHFKLWRDEVKRYWTEVTHEEKPDFLDQVCPLKINWHGYGDWYDQLNTTFCHSKTYEPDPRYCI